MGYRSLERNRPKEAMNALWAGILLEPNFVVNR